MRTALRIDLESEDHLHVENQEIQKPPELTYEQVSAVATRHRTDDCQRRGARKGSSLPSANGAGTSRGKCEEAASSSSSSSSSCSTPAPTAPCPPLLQFAACSSFRFASSSSSSSCCSVRQRNAREHAVSSGGERPSAPSAARGDVTDGDGAPCGALQRRTQRVRHGFP